MKQNFKLNMELSISFWLNGQKYYTEKKLTLYEILTYFNYNHSVLVLEHNNLIANQKFWPETFISNSDQIEIVTIVGGG